MAGDRSTDAPRRYWLQTLGCPKNDVDSDKLRGVLQRDGLQPATGPEDADVVVVNTCAFIDAARQESIDTVLALHERRREGSRLVVTGCMAERYGGELAAALPEVDLVAGFGQDLGTSVRAPQRGTIPLSVEPLPAFDLLNLPRPAASAPWAYVKVAEGCDRSCGFCAIPSFRGPQRSRPVEAVLEEVRRLAVPEVVLVAQDLAAYGRDQGQGRRRIVELVREVAGMVDRVRLLYLYPSDLSDGLIDVMCATGVPYFDLSLQHVSRALLRRMRRWGDGERFLRRIDDIRRREPEAVFRSSFIVGYPGETESDHDELLTFLEAAQLDWCGLFTFSREAGTHADGLDGHVPDALVAERMGEAGEIADRITAARRASLMGARLEVLVDSPGAARSHREAPEIDGIVEVPTDLAVGRFHEVVVTAVAGPDLIAEPAPLPARADRTRGAVA